MFSATAPHSPAVTRLTLTRFRSYATVRLHCDARPVVLTGPNGAGKTNLLEAISFLSPGRGLRRARLSEIEHQRPAVSDGIPPEEGWAPEGWAVAAGVQCGGRLVDIGTGRDLSHGPESERRLVRIDGRPAKSQVALADYISLVWLTPQMDRLFTEAASGRRRFLDRLVFGFDAGHAARLTRYDAAMRERARLLRLQISERRPADPTWLTTLEEGMAADGTAIAAARVDTVRRLEDAASRGVGPFPAPLLTMQGTIDDWLTQAPALQVEERLRDSLREARRRDAESGITGHGPHRSDLAVRDRDKGMPAALGSTGEQKALLIAMILANARLVRAERGMTPLLLLDEVAAHLDPQRRTALFDEILAGGGQAWLTGTDAETFAELGASVLHFRVTPGTLAPL
jgi:DNA replication and repair protein RecF